MTTHRLALLPPWDMALMEEVWYWEETLQPGRGAGWGGQGVLGEDVEAAREGLPSAQVSCGWTVDGGGEQRERPRRRRAVQGGHQALYLLLPVFSLFCDQS